MEIRVYAVTDTASIVMAVLRQCTRKIGLSHRPVPCTSLVQSKTPVDEFRTRLGACRSSFKPQCPNMNSCPRPRDAMSQPVHYWIVHWLNVLTWPAPLIFKAARAASRAARRQGHAHRG